MARCKILVVEDDQDILTLICRSVAREGYEVTGVTSGEEALAAARSNLPDLIILDLVLPRLSGFEVCSQLKADARTRDIAIIMVTGRGDDADVISGLKLGADDYVVKPISPPVLAARVGSVLRRKGREPEGQSAVLKRHDLVINPDKDEVLVGDKQIQLTTTEFRILFLLASRPGWVFHRTRIADAIRGQGQSAESRSIDVHIAALRKKLGPAGAYIETVRGAGYRFK